jgi:hypothetical protein
VGDTGPAAAGRRDARGVVRDGAGGTRGGGDEEAERPQGAPVAAAREAVSANADRYPATARPPAPTVPPVTAIARRRVIVLFLWFPVMIGKIETPAIKDVRRSCGAPELYA